MFAQSQFGQTLLENSRTLHKFIEEQDMAALRQLLQAYDDGELGSEESEIPPVEP